MLLEFTVFIEFTRTIKEFTLLGSLKEPVFSVGLPRSECAVVSRVSIIIMKVLARQITGITRVIH